MADPNQLTKLNEGVEAWNQWRKAHPDIQPDLRGASLSGSNLQGIDLSEACLEGANLFGAHLEGANLEQAHLGATNLQEAFFDKTTKLTNAHLSTDKGVGPKLADVHWGQVNLSCLGWSSVQWLGNEYEARLAKDRDRQINEYQAAVRTNRQLTTVLRAQGINEEADSFAYQAQVLQRQVFLYQLPQQMNQKKLFLRAPGLLLLRVILIFLVFIAIVALFTDKHIRSICILEPFYQEGCPLLLHAIPLAIADLPILSLVMFMSLGGLLVTLLPEIYLSQQKESHGQVVLPTLILLVGLLLFVLPPSIILVPKLLSLPLSIVLSLVLPPSLVYLIWKLCQIYWRWIVRNLKMDFGSILFLVVSLAAALEALVIGLYLLYALIVPLYQSVVEEFPPTDNIQFVLLLFFVYLVWSLLQRLKRIQTLKQNIGTVLGNYGNYALSLFLDVIAGYGYKPQRTISVYLLIVVLFAYFYYTFGDVAHVPLSPLGALILSVTSFHGRGFFPGISVNGQPNGTITLENPMIVLAAIEAVVGLIIEISFIATFTQRFFGK